MFKLTIIILLILQDFSNHVSAETDKIICYYTKTSVTVFPPSDIDANICTHIIYAFLSLSNDGSLGGIENDVVTKLSDLKKANNQLKLLFTVGGESAASKIFSAVAESPEKLNKMASSAVQLLKIYKFDGIDIDWEFPGKSGGKPQDKKNFINMLKTLWKNLKASNSELLLTVAVRSVPDRDSYDVENITKWVDFINVMTYDFHGNDGKTGENAPLYPSSKDSKWQKENANCDAAIKNWEKRGASSSKLILGLAFYGYSYELKNSTDHGIGAPTIRINGAMTYGQICKLKTGWEEVWDDEEKVPYKYKNTTWIGYDNTTSIGLKVQYAKEKNLGGVMIWAVPQDDRCKQQLNCCGVHIWRTNGLVPRWRHMICGAAKSSAAATD